MIITIRSINSGNLIETTADGEDVRARESGFLVVFYREEISSGEINFIPRTEANTEHDAIRAVLGRARRY